MGYPRPIAWGKAFALPRLGSALKAVEGIEYFVEPTAVLVLRRVATLVPLRRNIEDSVGRYQQHPYRARVALACIGEARGELDFQALRVRVDVEGTVVDAFQVDVLATLGGFEGVSHAVEQGLDDALHKAATVEREEVARRFDRSGEVGARVFQHTQDDSVAILRLRLFDGVALQEGADLGDGVLFHFSILLVVGSCPFPCLYIITIPDGSQYFF